MNLDFIQIGANIGNTDNDPVYPRVLSAEFKTGILIEANPNCIDKLKNNYSSYPDLIIEHTAISSNIKSIKFYIDNFYTTGVSQHSSTSLDFLHAHHHKDNNITEIEVPCTTLENIFQKYNIEKVNWLFVDTEGHDFEILISTDFSKLNIENIHFEHTHTDGAHNKGNNYNKLIDYLKSFNYKVISIGQEDTIITLDK